MASSLVFVVGSIVLGAALNQETLLIGRAIVGLGIGKVIFFVPTSLLQL